MSGIATSYHLLHLVAQLGDGFVIGAFHVEAEKWLGI
jgi:hypothetical protein